MEIFLSIFVLFCIFAIGTLFGSFFSLANYRIPRKEDITHTRSYCPKCKHKLSFFDLIPVLSYVFSFGKCRYCNEKISKRYILLEVTHGILFVIVYIIIFYLTKNPMNTLVISMIFYIFYATIFVIIGSNVMKKKNEKTKLESKKGVYVVELVVAFIIFLILISSSLIITRNYSYNLYLKTAESHLINETAYKLEQLKNGYYTSGYNTAVSETEQYTKDGVTYNMNLEVVNYKDKENVRYDLIKILNLTLTCNINGKDISYSLSDYILNYNLLRGE